MYLIDGYNLLYQTDFSEKEGLIHAIDKFCRARHKNATIVFDGRCPYNLSTDFVQVIFTGNADEGIAEIIQKCDNLGYRCTDKHTDCTDYEKKGSNPASKYVLISSDKELRSLARRSGIKMIRAEEFDFSVGKTKSSGDEKGRGFLTESEAREQLEEFNNFQ